MVTFVQKLLCNHVGELYARRKSAALFSILDAQNIEYDPRDTAIHHVLTYNLFNDRGYAYCRLIKCRKEELDRWVTVVGLDNLKNLLDNSRGVLVLTNHFGPNNVGTYFLRAKGYRVHSLRSSDRLMKRYRLTAAECRAPVEVYLSHDKSPGYIKTMRTLHDLLSQGNIVVGALDIGGTQQSHIWLPLMGYQRPFQIGLPLIAARAGARIVQRFESLKTDGSIEVRFEQPFPEFQNDRSPTAYAEEIVRAYVNRLEAFFEAQPAQIKPRKIVSWHSRYPAPDENPH